MAKFFENSLAELRARNAGVEGAFRRIDGNRFTAVVYRHGKALARCTVFMGRGPHAGYRLRGAGDERQQFLQ